MLHKTLNSRKGIATIPTILALVILILAIGIGISALSLTESFIAAGQDLSSKALRYADTGAKDALIHIARDKTYSCAAADCYQIDFDPGGTGCATNNACVRVSVSSSTGSVADPKIINATGRTGTIQRQIRVTVILDSSLNGQIATSTWQEL